MVCKEIACLLPIRHDYDIVYDHLVYYYNLGCKNFFVLIHCSNGQDAMEIQRFKSDSGCNVTIHEDPNPKYQQDKHYALLSEMAKDFKWHVMSDTDELLILKENSTLQDFFRGIDADSVLFRWYPYIDIFGDKCFRWSHRTAKPANWTKVAMRYRKGLNWSWGHHHVTGGHKVFNAPNAFYGHFILRDKEMWIQRKLNFADAKRLRFGDNAWWMKQCSYHEIKNDSNFLHKKWDKAKKKNFSKDLVYDPISPGLFELKKGTG